MLWAKLIKFMPTISQSDQVQAIQYIQETFANYVNLNEDHRTLMADIYREYRSFRQPRKNDWSSSFKVNYAHTTVNKTLPRLIANNPRWLVNLKKDEFVETDRFLQGEDRAVRLEEMREMTKWVNAYLSYIWERYNLREPARLWAKNMLTYWNAYAKIKFKYETARVRENWKIVEKVIWEYPTIDPVSWSNIYVDPRYVLLEDMPWIIEVTERVRFADLKRKKDKYINLDKVENLPSDSEFENNQQWSKARIYEITWIPMNDINSWVNKNELTLRTYTWKYAKGDEDEKLYKITTVSDLVMIEMEEITSMPYEDIKAFDDTETHFATWMVEPILSLQDEANFKKNSASEYINNALNRSWIWSPNSWVNPRDLVSRPNNIIATTNDAITAQNNLVELPHRNLTTDYFQEQNDLERQIQTATFTVDTASQQSNQALTNTATWIRVKFFENNAVIDELRKHFEEWLEKLAYKLLDATFENMEENIVIKKIWEDGFWEINKELLRDALNRYEIKVESNSSSFDDLESRREDAIWFFNVLTQAAQMWVQVDFNEATKDIISTFEKRDADKFLNWQSQAWPWGATQIQQPERTQSPAATLTWDVAWGKQLIAWQ